MHILSEDFNTKVRRENIFQNENWGFKSAKG